MTRLTPEDLRLKTLSRQFPPVGPPGPAAVLELFERLGPIQSQVPRAPFLTASSRLPGADHRSVCGLFESHQLLKTTTLRGTVHTTGRQQYGWSDAVARRGRAALLRRYLKLQRTTPEAVAAEAEAYADDRWRSRADLVAYLRAWLTEHESPASAAALTGSLPESLIWGHSGLLRRPRDERWEKRTDTFHRRARSLVPTLGVHDVEVALAELVRGYLRAYGPATRQDVAYFHGTGLGAADAAVRRLGEEVVHLPGPDRADFLDLADPPSQDGRDPGVRLLPEFDGLLVGYSGRWRTRFLSDAELAEVWSPVNGQFAPLVLAAGRIVGSWKTLAHGRSSDVEVRMLPGHAALPEDQLAGAVADVARVLDLEVCDVRVHPAG